MRALEQKRRSFLLGLGGLGMSQILRRKSIAHAQAAARRGYVLPAGGGEHLIHFRDHGNIFISISAVTGSDRFALGSQQVTVGAGIPIHRHLEMDEAFYVLEGSGVVTLNDVRHSFDKGGTIFIPKNSWHGFENPDHENPPSLGCHACWPGRLFPRDLQSTRCSPKTAHSRANQRDCPEIWDRVSIIKTGRMPRTVALSVTGW